MRWHELYKVANPVDYVHDKYRLIQTVNDLCHKCKNLSIVSVIYV